MEHKPHILVTRDASGNAELAAALTLSGFAVTRWDSFAYQALPVADWGALLQNQDWLIFTSTAAVRFFFASQTPAACASLQVACVGEKTAEAVRRFGVDVALVARVATSAGLAHEAVFQNSQNLKILWPQAQDGRDDFATQLAARHQITRVAHYAKTFFPVPEAVKTAVQNGQIAAVLFYSPSVVRHFVRELGTNPKIWRGLRVGVIGETTAREAEACGLTVSFRAEAAATASLIASLRAVLGA